MLIRNILKETMTGDRELRLSGRKSRLFKASLVAKHDLGFARRLDGECKADRFPKEKVLALIDDIRRQLLTSSMSMPLGSPVLNTQRGRVFDSPVPSTQPKPFDCAEIGDLISKNIGKKAGHLRAFARDYRLQMGKWIDGESDYVNPPSMDLLSLGHEVTHDNLGKFLDIFNSLQSRFGTWNKQTGMRIEDDPNIDGAMVRYKATDPRIMSTKDRMVENIKNLVGKDIFYTTFSWQRENVLSAMEKYASVPQNAFDLFVTILNRDLVHYNYRDLLKIALNGLKENKHFLKSLIALLDGCLSNIFDQKPIPLPNKLITELLGMLVELGLVQELSSEEDVDQTTSVARDRNVQKIPLSIDPQNNVNYIYLSFPADIVPSHWNAHRIVDPVIASSFQEFSGALNEVQIEPFFLEREMPALIAKLRNERRYAVDFARIPFWEIQEMADKVVFQFFTLRKGMNKSDIGVEIKIGEDTIVYFIDSNGEMTLPQQGISSPSIRHLSVEKTDYNLLIDYLYRIRECENWTSPENLQKLKYFILSYAVHIFCTPRSLERQKNEHENNGSGTSDVVLADTRNTFGLQFEPDVRKIIPDNVNNLEKDDGDRNLEGAAHRKPEKVIGHILKLRPGFKPSDEALKHAAQEGFDFLPPGYSFRKTRRILALAGQTTEPVIFDKK